MPSGIVEVFFFSIRTDCFNNARPTHIGIKHGVFALVCEGMRKVLLLVAWVWLVLPSITSSRGMLSLELWCQANPQGLLGRPHLVKTVLCSGWSMCSDLDGMDEEFVWNEGWPENDQQPALVPWLLCLWTHNEAPIDCQPPPSPLEVITNLPKCTLNKIMHTICRKPYIFPTSLPLDLTSRYNMNNLLLPWCKNLFPTAYRKNQYIYMLITICWEFDYTHSCRIWVWSSKCL